MTQTSTASIRPTELASDGEPAGDCFLIDVRSPGEFAGAHIEGSLNVPLGDIDRNLDALRERAAEHRLALVCRTGRRAEEARKLLASRGLEEVQVLEGGVTAWEAAGLPLRRGEGGMSIERQTRIVAGTMVVTGAVLAMTVHPGFAALCAFVGAGLAHAGLTDSCAMGMLLARMPWNRAR